MQLLSSALPFLMVLLSCYLLKHLCDQFEIGAGFLGRNLPAGVKGATINAMGSSMPEMFTVIACLFFFNDPAMVLVGLGVTAGSAIFNGCVIPAISILVARDSNGKKVDFIELDKGSLLRDIFWVFVAEIALVVILGFGAITMSMVILLNLIYVGYAVHLYIHSKRNGTDSVEEYEEDSVEPSNYGTLGDLLAFNFYYLLFKNNGLRVSTAIVVLVLAILGISAASHLLVEGIVGAADVMGIPQFFSGMILGAAASSIPDLILSIKDARKGNYEDAVANPLGSNTFDTTVAFAAPLLVWFLINGENSLALTQDGALTMLRISIIAVTIGVAASLLFKYRRVTKSVAYTLLGIFGTWVGFVVYLLA
jgi:cation:H+ antiporter